MAKKRKAKVKTISTTLNTEQNIEFKIVDNKANIKLNTIQTKGENKRIGLTIKPNKKNKGGIYMIDLIVGDYKVRRNNLIGTEAKWHHTPTNTDTTTDIELMIYDISGQEDGDCSGVITIINQ
tara:strand:+ start:5947 stop:6315 length:369 start_codon:yes stop_codon:yes gene_type:complete